jgi:hypothetical protein
MTRTFFPSLYIIIFFNIYSNMPQLIHVLRVYTHVCAECRLRVGVPALLIAFVNNKRRWTHIKFSQTNAKYAQYFTTP